MGCVCDMLALMKSLCLHLWPNEVQNIDELRLNMVLRMLKSPHFNAKMNSLKEVGFVLWLYLMCLKLLLNIYLVLF